MSVSIDVYRAAIGLFNSPRLISISYFCSISDKFSLVGTLLIVLFIVALLITMANDVELNPGPFNSLKFGHLNVRSLNNQDKFDELSLIIKDNNFHIFAISETWLSNDISNDNFNIVRYNSIMHLDRSHRTGGGVALFSIDSILLQRRYDLELPGLEFLWVEFSVSGRNFLFGVCYRPPDNDSVLLVNFLNGLQFMLDKIRTLGGNYTIIILGDFNAHYNVQLPLNSSEIGKQLSNFITINGLEQLISEPTRVTSNTSSILDLLITNCSNDFLNTGTLSSPQNFDHPIIYGEMTVFPTQISWERYRFQRNQTNYLIQTVKKNYFRKLNFDLCDLSVSKKKWWSLVKQVYDNRLSSLTSSALIENDILISDPLEKARLFNSFFVSQSKLDGVENIPPSVEPFQTSAYISDIVRLNRMCIIY